MTVHKKASWLIQCLYELIINREQNWKWHLVFQDPLADISQISLGKYKANVSPDVGEQPEKTQQIIIKFWVFSVFYLLCRNDHEIAKPKISHISKEFSNAYCSDIDGKFTHHELPAAVGSAFSSSTSDTQVICNFHLKFITAV